MLCLCGVQQCYARAYFAKIAIFVSVPLIIFYYVPCCLPALVQCDARPEAKLRQYEYDEGDNIQTPRAPRVEH